MTGPGGPAAARAAGAADGGVLQCVQLLGPLPFLRGRRGHRAPPVRVFGEQVV